MFNVYDSIENIEQVKKADIILYSASKDEVINRDFKRIRKNLDILKMAGKSAKGKLFLAFDGYENDIREIYMIPEIRRYVKTIWEEYKYIFYFLTSFDNNKAIVFACINDFKSYQDINNKKIKLVILYNDEIKVKTVTSTEKFGILINDLDGARRELLKLYK